MRNVHSRLCWEGNINDDFTVWENKVFLAAQLGK